MRNRSILFLIALISVLQGCASLAPQPISFNTNKGNLSFVKTGCTLGDFKYADTSGNGAQFPHFRMISVDSAENTMDEFTISCQSVLPNRTSNCSHSVNTKNTYMSYGGPGCPDLNRFKLFSY